MGKFEKFQVWPIAKGIAIKIYRLTDSKYFSKDYVLKDQIQRAAVSIASNIAEGDRISAMLSKLIKARSE
jgi:four helix bundle protein